MLYRTITKFSFLLFRAMAHIRLSFKHYTCTTTPVAVTRNHRIYRVLCDFFRGDIRLYLIFTPVDHSLTSSCRNAWTNQDLASHDKWLTNLDFADDSASVAEEGNVCQGMATNIAVHSAKFGLPVYPSAKRRQRVAQLSQRNCTAGCVGFGQNVTGSPFAVPVQRMCPTKWNLLTRVLQ